MNAIASRARVAAVTVLGTFPAIASRELAQKNDCLACHADANELVGPACQDVAKKRKAQKDALTTVTANIKKGGSGKCGPVPMPPQATLSDADAQALARWTSD
jgi:cytochrome c